MTAQIQQTERFSKWLDALADRIAKRRILSRIDQLSFGLPGDVGSAGEGISELRIHIGPGYRVYYKQSGKTIYFLLVGGDKSTQKRDIAAAKEIARELGI